MEESVFLAEFQSRATQALLKTSKDLGLSNGELLETEDINQLWEECAADYMADAVKEFNSYPEVALGWAAYLGMAAAYLWDNDWNKNQHIKNLYKVISYKRGFDEMDEFIIEEIMGMELKSYEHVKAENGVRSLASGVLQLMSKESPEVQTERAFHIFAAAVNSMFKIGASVGLYMLGYKFEKVSASELVS